ncbi:MAG: hypothetical protein J6J36_03020 [Clostridia bacterium]|nr:hypothetical protein [Clostridia bacterium]
MKKSPLKKYKELLKQGYNIYDFRKFDEIEMWIGQLNWGELKEEDRELVDISTIKNYDNVIEEIAYKSELIIEAYNDLADESTNNYVKDLCDSLSRDDIIFTCAVIYAVEHYNQLKNICEDCIKTLDFVEKVAKSYFYQEEEE